MKKILLALTFIVAIGLSNRAEAQCNGASVTVTNFVVVFPNNSIHYSFDWQFVRGNASIQVVDSCNGVFEHAEPCIPFLKDSAAGVHHVTGTFTSNCTGTLTVAVL